MMEPVTINNELQREIDVRPSGNFVRVIMTDTSEPAKCVAASLTPDDCKALEAALAKARAEATPASSPEDDLSEFVAKGYDKKAEGVTQVPSEATPAGSEEGGEAISPEDFGKKFKAIAKERGGYVANFEHGSLVIADDTNWISFKLAISDATTLRKALTKFIGDEPDAPEPAAKANAPETKTTVWGHAEEKIEFKVTERGAVLTITEEPEEKSSESHQQWAALPKEAVAQLHKAMGDFLGDAPEPYKPSAEVIAEHGEDVLVRIGSMSFLIHQAEFGTSCFRKNRRKAQVKMLEWGRSVDDIYHATQAIAD